MTWDIFCNVIDNFGDIGVSWRLSRQLCEEFGIEVRLWVDDLDSFLRIHPQGKRVAVQHCCGVEVRAWGEPFPEVAPGEVVIEAFGCLIPESFVARMAQAKPLWINLEYLSAEEWVRSAHLMQSPHPRLPIVKHFFFPGFFPDSGGLLIERDLLKSRDAFIADGLAQYRERMGGGFEGRLCVSLFGYGNDALERLLQTWAEGEEEILCLIPEGKIADQAKSIVARGMGNLEIRIIPFVPQEQYDLLLWACDINFVRGEDSFVRAQWAGKPFVWQIYPQEEGIHMQKLDAFLDLYCEDFPHGDAVRKFWHAWNGDGEIGGAWREFLRCRESLGSHGESWAKRLSNHGLASSLLDFSCRFG